MNQQQHSDTSLKLDEKPCYFNIEKDGDHITLSEVSSIGEYKMDTFKEEKSKVVKKIPF